MEFKQIELINTIERTTRINKFFSKFFPKRNTHLGEVLEVHTKKGKKKMAPFVSPREGGKILTREGFETFTITTPKLAPSRVLTIDNIKNRMFGEEIYSKKTPQERAMEIFAKDLTDLEDSIANRLEWMCRMILLGEPIVIIDKDAGVDIGVNFNFTNKETLLSGTKWTDETSDPIGDIRRWKRNVIRKSGVSPNICLMGENAWTAFFNHPNVKEILDIKNIVIGEVNPSVVDDSLTYQAKIAGVEIYTYDEWILDDDGEDLAMLPLDTVMLLSSEIGSVEYGSITLIDESEDFKTYESELVPEIFTNRKNHTKELIVNSRPLPVPYDVDSWGVYKVCD